MRMQDVAVGRVYVRGYHQGRHGVSATHQRVMVDATYVSEIGRSRQDRVQVHNVSWDEEKQQWNYTGQYDVDGNPWRYLLMARELLTIEEVEEQKREQARQEEIRKRRNAALTAYQRECELELAKRIGAPLESVQVFGSVSSMPDPETGIFQCSAGRGLIDASAIEAMMGFDPDPEIVLALLEEVWERGEISTITPVELAERIVGALRPKVEEPSDD